MQTDGTGRWPLCKAWQCEGDLEHTMDYNMDSGAVSQGSLNDYEIGNNTNGENNVLLGADGSHSLEYEFVQCLFCLTGHEEAVVRDINEKGLAYAIFPRVVKRMLRNYQWIEEVHPLFRGYVFLYLKTPIVDRWKNLLVNQSIIRILGCEDGGDGYLVGEDRIFADWLWRRNGLINVMKAVRVGERVEIIDGAFKELHGTVVQMDRRRQTAKVELTTMGVPKYIWIAYDYLEEQLG